MKYIALILSLIVMTACSSDKSVDVSGINVNSKLVRFDSLYYSIQSEKDFAELKKEYPLMFSSEVSDSVWIAKARSEEEQEVYKRALAIFGDFHKQYNEIIDVFKHVKYYYPDFKSPDVYTILSGFDYRYPVLYAEDIMFVSLDMYLGVDYEEYGMFPRYLVSNMVQERIKVDVAGAISRSLTAVDDFDRTFLSQMIYNGKILYMSQKLIPASSDELLMGYTKNQLDWCKKNEKDIWAYMIKNKLIYSKDENLNKRFISVAPFSKFYSKLDRQSPGRVGVWLGWQIVKSYMDNNDVSLPELMSNDNALEILSKSKYKPSK